MRAVMLKFAAPIPFCPTPFCPTPLCPTPFCPTLQLDLTRRAETKRSMDEQAFTVRED